jgi:predicted Zn-dependent protease
MTVADPAVLAERLVEMVGHRAEAAVTVTHSRQGLTRFANSFIHQNVVDEHTEVNLQLSQDGRPASATTYRTDDEALASLVDRALSAAALRPVDPHWGGLAPPAGLAGPKDVHYDAATARVGPAERAEAVAAFVAAGGGLEAAGFCETSLSDRYFANSAGQRVDSHDTSAAFDAIVRVPGSDGRPGSDGVASTYSSRFADLDGEALGRHAAGRARSGAGPVELPAGRYEVVLEARCVAYLMDFFTFYGFNGRGVTEGRSFVAVGERQLDPVLSMSDDATDPRQLGPLFDAEGTPKSRLPLVAAGVVTGVTHDRRSAARAGGGTATTGHAVDGGEAFGAVATATLLEAAPGTGPTGGARPAASLVPGVERGLLVSDFWYTRVLDPKTLVATGLTRNGVFLIENGEVGRAVSNLRFTQSYVAALAPGQVLGVGDDGRLAPGGLHISLHYAPSLHLAAWNFTGNASA